MSKNLYDELNTLIGKDGPPITGPDTVCKAMIRHWCEAMEDSNPLYTDEEFAARSRYGSIISPPTMVQAWTFDALWPNGQEMRFRHPDLLPKKDLSPCEVALQKLDRANYTGVIITDTTFEFIRPLFPGDRVTQVARIDAISQEKQTRLGGGHFLTLGFTYTNQKRELVCNQHVSMLKFKPPQKEPTDRQELPSRDAAPDGLAHQRTNVNTLDFTVKVGRESLIWEDIDVGGALPHFAKYVTATTVVAGSIASRDFTPVHHDRNYANKQGLPDIFINFMTAAGWVGKYLTAWSGSDGELKRLAIRIGAPCFPGDTLTFSGKVVNKHVEEKQHLVDVGFDVSVAVGSHCSGTAIIALPAN